MEIAENPIEIYAVVEDVVTMSQALASTKDITFKSRVGKLQNNYVYADKLHTNQVVINLISNAIKYTKLELFSNYLNHPERIDVDWQNSLVMKINSWLNCSINTHLIYDYDVPFYTPEGALIKGSKVQFKELKKRNNQYHLLITNKLNN